MSAPHSSAGVGIFSAYPADPADPDDSIDPVDPDDPNNIPVLPEAGGDIIVDDPGEGDHTTVQPKDEGESI